MRSLKHLKCIAKDCNENHHCRGYCKRHYSRWYYGGDPNNPNRIRFAHQMKNHPLYSSWAGMRARCNNPKHISYKNYGGRGIKVCKRWDNFALFVEDMGERPRGHTLDRIDTNKNYSPDNCRWATGNEQARNIQTPSDNKIGVAGVIKKTPNKYLVRIGFNHKRNYIGSYGTLEEAISARLTAEAIYWG